MLASPAHLTAGLCANKWLEEAMNSVGGGKGGGKPDQANGSVSGTGAHIVTQLVAAATESANSKLV